MSEQENPIFAALESRIARGRKLAIFVATLVAFEAVTTIVVRHSVSTMAERVARLDTAYTRLNEVANAADVTSQRNARLLQDVGDFVIADRPRVLHVIRGAEVSLREAIQRCNIAQIHRPIPLNASVIRLLMQHEYWAMLGSSALLDKAREMDALAAVWASIRPTTEYVAFARDNAATWERMMNKRDAASILEEGLVRNERPVTENISKREIVEREAVLLACIVQLDLPWVDDGTVPASPWVRQLFDPRTP